MSSGAWAEGDTLSPSNLNNKGGGNFPDRTYNAGWAQFGTANTATETRIQAAITQAATDGVSFVFVPKSMIPYDASLVTFSSAVRMLREGASPMGSDFDVKAYGAGVSDAGNYAAFTYLFNLFTSRSEAPSNEGGTVYVPEGTYGVSKPLWLKSRGTRLVGDGSGWVTSRGGSVIKGNHSAGPILFISPSSRTLAGLTTALATGTGSAWANANATGSRYYFNLRESPTLDINGKSALTVRFFYKPDDVVNTANFVASNGNFISSDAAATAFSISRTGATVNATMKLSGGAVSLSGGTLVTGTTSVIELSYDGTTVRLFIDGTIVDSAAASGTVVQADSEEVLLGPLTNQGMELTSSITFGGILGTIDSVEIADVARNTVGYTKPTAKFSPDSHTLILINWDEQIGPLEKVYIGASNTGWLAQRDQNQSGGPDVEVRGISLSSNGHLCSGVLMTAATNWTIRDCNFQNLRYGIIATQGNNYIFLAERLSITNTTRFGLWFFGNSGLGHINLLNTDGCIVPVLLAGASPGGTVITKWFAESRAEMIYHLISVNDGGGLEGPLELMAPTLSTEAGVGGSTYRGNFLVWGTGGIHCIGGQFETANNKPYLRLEGTGIQRFVNTNFTGTGAPTTVSISSAALGTNSITVFSGCLQAANWVPWSNTTGAVAIIGFGTRNSSSTGSTIKFDATRYSNWDLTLTSDVTQSSWQSVTYGQPVSGAIKMDSTGSRLFTWPTNSKGTATLSYGSSAVNTFTGFYDGVNVILTSVRTGL